MTRVSSAKRNLKLVITQRKEKYANTSLILDLDKCQGCNLCYTVCPRYAIERGPIGASLRKRVKAPVIRVNYYKCVFCGLCAYICPFGALTLMVNNQPTEKIKRGKSLPFLEGEEVICKRAGIKALKFIEGEIKVNDDLCPSGCSTCIDICPTSCLHLPTASKEKPWEKTPKIGVNREDCLYCGACVFACPSQGAIELIRTNLKHSKEGAESRIWQNIENRLKKPVFSRYWFYEEWLETAPGGGRKSAQKQKG